MSFDLANAHEMNRL